ncbi:hypothetical protein NKJ56_30340 [Mesorhizobium sp. M0093]
MAGDRLRIVMSSIMRRTKWAQLKHLIAPVLEIALQQPQPFKTAASPANRSPNAALAASFNPESLKTRHAFGVNREENHRAGREHGYAGKELAISSADRKPHLNS